MEKKIYGLSMQEVEEKRKKGEGEQEPESITKSKKQIIRENVLTLFNLLNFIIAGLLFAVGAYTNMIFIAIIILNIVIGIAQECKAKKLVDELSILNRPAIKVRREGEDQEIELKDIVKGDIVILESGSQICNDSIVTSGSLEVNESLLTGESDPVIKEVGSTLYSGSSVISGKACAEVIHVGNDNYATSLVNEVKKEKQVQSELLGSMRKVTRFTSSLIIPLGILLFLEAFVLRKAPVNESVVASAAALLGMLPKGLVLLISVSLATGVIRLAKMKILVQNIYSLETLAHVDTLCLDKTGTITTGEPRVTDILPAEGYTKRDLMQLAADLESSSEHPLAKAVMEHAKATGISQTAVHDFQALPGNGLSAVRGEDLLLGGSVSYMKENVTVDSTLLDQAQKLAEEGKTPLLFAKNHTCAGLIAVADTLKEDSPQAVAELRDMGIRVIMLTGDNERTAKAIGAQAGVDEVIAGGLPGGKEAEIRKLKEQGKVAMVGDGINDAPALTRADTGIAIGAGTDVAIDAASVVLVKSRLRDVPAAIRLSRATLRNIHENLFWAFCYNTIGIPIAAGLLYALGGPLLSPMFAGAAMSLSSVCVVGNALRLGTVKL